MTGNTIHNDNVKSIYGTGSDLQIYHDGNNSYIAESGTGLLNIFSNGTGINLLKNTGEFMAEFSTDGAVSLFYDNAIKLATTNTGISVTGDGAFSGNVDAVGIVKVGSANSEFSEGHLRFNYNGGAYIDQAVVTESIFFRTSNNFSLDTTALTISRNGDLTTGRNVTIAGDLTVNGTTTTVNSQTLAVVDPLIQLAKDNTANSLDIGLYGDYSDGTGRYLGLFSDASDGNKFKLFKGTTVEPTTTVNIGAAGYTAADLQVAAFEATSGTFSGQVVIDTGSYAPLKISRTSAQNVNVWFHNTVNERYLGTSDDGELHWGSSVDANSNPSIITTVGTTTNVNIAGSLTGTSASFSGSIGIGSTAGLAKLNITKDNTSGNALEILNSGSSRSLDINHNADGTGTTDDIVRISNNSVRKVTIDNAGNTTFTSSLTGTSASFSASISASGNSNSFGNTTTAALSTSSISSTGSLAISGNSNSIGITTFTGALTGTSAAFSGSVQVGATTGYTTISQGAFFSKGGGNMFTGNILAGAAITPVYKIQRNDATKFSIGLGTVDELAFIAPDGLAKMLIDTSGNAGIFGKLGIGAAFGSAMLDVRGNSDSSDVLVQLDNNKYGSTDTSGETKIRFGWLNHSAAGIAAYKDGTVNRTGFKFYTEVGFNAETLAMQLTSAGNLIIGSENDPYLAMVSSGGNGYNQRFRMSGYADGGTYGGGFKIQTRNDANVFNDALLINRNGDVIINDAGGNAGLTMQGGAANNETYIIGQGITGVSNGGFSIRNSSEAKDVIVFQDITGNVGIGTDSPYQKTVINGHLAFTTGTAATDYASDVRRNGIGWQASAGVGNLSAFITSNTVGSWGGDLRFYTRGAGSGSLIEGMVIDSVGNVVFKNGTLKIGDSTTAELLIIPTTNNTAPALLQFHKEDNGSSTVLQFLHQSAEKGSISYTNTTTTYNTTSDYRLKEDLQDFNGLDKVSKIPVYDFKWKTDESRSYGVMAHELQEVLPDAVSGEKDAEEMQGVDYSKIVPLLVKSIQELTAKVEMLEKNCQCKN